VKLDRGRNPPPHDAAQASAGSDGKALPILIDLRRKSNEIIVDDACEFRSYATGSCSPQRRLFGQVLPHQAAVIPAF